MVDGALYMVCHGDEVVVFHARLDLRKWEVREHPERVSTAKHPPRVEVRVLEDLDHTKDAPNSEPNYPVEVCC